MGRKAKATKPLTAFQSPPKAQTSSAGGTFVSTKADPRVANTSRSVKKKVKTHGVIRRSVRFQSAVVTNQELQPVSEEMNISKCQKEDVPLLHDENKFREQASDETESFSKEDNPGVADLKYKTMYTRSQIKMEALLEENKQLTKALEFANGKVDVYEKQSSVYSEVMAVIASLSRVNENLSVLVKLPVAPNDDK